MAALEARLAAAAAQTAGLEERLARQKDYETVKKDLAILRTLEFSSSQQEEEGGDSSRPLEVLILERSKVKTREAAGGLHFIFPVLQVFNQVVSDLTLS